MAARKRPKRKSSSAGSTKKKGAPRRSRRPSAAEGSFASEMKSSVNDVLDEVDRLAESIARALGLREGRG
jgi:hypothetical protein